MSIDRRVFIRKLLIGAGILTLFPKSLLASEKCEVAHPFMPPNTHFKGSCHNCGMSRPMWARTWHTYQHGEQKLEVCSMHCLAEATQNSGHAPEMVMASLYLHPEKSLPVEKVYYVIGSKARGTMTMKSKLAFSSQKEATAFAQECGGTVTRFEETYQVAMAKVEKENTMINRNRIAKGKIVEPVEGTDICPVCGMHPARYPKNKCQIRTKNGKVIHFCATQCLFEFLNNPQKYDSSDLVAQSIWVVDYDKGEWIYARNAYYVVGTKVRGPMGSEAFPFVNLASAEKFSKAHSGKVLRFEKVTIDQIVI